MTLPLPGNPPARAELVRSAAAEAAVAAVYRHVRADAAQAASAQNWPEWARLLEIAQTIQRNYPTVSARARFAGELPG